MSKDRLVIRKGVAQHATCHMQVANIFLISCCVIQFYLHLSSLFPQYEGQRQ